MKWTINHLEDLNKVAAEFLDYVGDKTIFALYGPMGVGKTTFVKAVAACLGVTDDVSSPTFALVNEYQTKNGKSLYHFDFYRVTHIAEALDFGYEAVSYTHLQTSEACRTLFEQSVRNGSRNEKYPFIVSFFS